MCIVCQNVPAVMTGLSGAGLIVRTAVRRARAPRAQQAAATPAGEHPMRADAQPPTPGTGAAPAPAGAR